MKKRKSQGFSKAKAIQNALARLGLQASAKQVVAAVASFGIDVSEALVCRVKRGMLKEVAKMERQRVKIPKAERPRVWHPPKVPPRRSFRA